MAIYGYARVSTGKQVQKELSLPDQERRMTKRAEEYDWTVDEIFVDEGVSAIKFDWPQRPAGRRLFARLQSGDIVMVTKLDRAFRRPLDMLSVIEDFNKRGITLLVFDMGGEVTKRGSVGKLITTLLSAVAKFEGHMISERTRNARAEMREQHKFLGGRRQFGSRQIGTIRKDRPREQNDVADLEAAALPLITTAAEAGMSLRGITEMLANRRGIKTSHTTVQRVLRRHQQSQSALQ
jgi:DNA invertase Pin-like site-specific DNA recombinase